MGEVKAISQRWPKATFLVGTPIYEEKGEKPTNSVIYFKEGETIGKTSKRAGATDWERESFRFTADEPPALIPGTNIGVLICADLATAALYSRSAFNIDEVLKASGRSNLIGQQPTFVADKTAMMVVPSCWGVGGQSWLMGRTDPILYITSS